MISVRTVKEEYQYALKVEERLARKKKPARQR
jgi:hypothetical protein